MGDCDLRQSELKRKCKELRRRVQTKEQEVQETRNKIERATQKTEEEKRQQVEKDEEIEDTQEAVRGEESSYKKMIRDLERTTQYKLFLDMVCDQNQDYFEEVDNILDRHTTLTSQQKEQGEKLVNYNTLIETQQKSYSQHSKSSVTQVLEGNAALASHRENLDALIAGRKETDIENQKIQEKEQRALMNLGSIEMAVDNIHSRAVTEALDGERLTTAQKQEVERILKLPRHEKSISMLERLAILYVDLEAISKFAKEHPKKEDQLQDYNHDSQYDSPNSARSPIGSPKMQGYAPGSVLLSPQRGSVAGGSMMSGFGDTQGTSVSRHSVPSSTRSP